MSQDGIAFTIPGAARGQGRPRITARGGFGRAYKAKADLNNENMISFLANAAMRGRLPYECPMALAVDVYVAPAQSWSKKRVAAALGGDRPTTKPDLDNIIKAILDACNRIVFADDKQIVQIVANKHFRAQAGTDVRISPHGIS